MQDGLIRINSLETLYSPAVLRILCSTMAVTVTEAIISISAMIIDSHFVCFCRRQCCCQYDVTTADQVYTSATVTYLLACLLRSSNQQHWSQSTPNERRE
jgi:hypothetical protein